MMHVVYQVLWPFPIENGVLFVSCWLTYCCPEDILADGMRFLAELANAERLKWVNVWTVRQGKERWLL